MQLTLDISDRQALLIRKVIFETYLHAKGSVSRLSLLPDLKVVEQEMRERANDSYDIYRKISEQIRDLPMGTSDHPEHDRQWNDPH